MRSNGGTHEINNGKTANPSCFCLFEWTFGGVLAYIREDAGLQQQFVTANFECPGSYF
jgi:hypothetical protein